MAFNLMIESFKLPFFHYVYVLALVPLIFAYVALTQPRLYNGFPAVAIDDKGIFKLSRAKDYFASNSKLILEKGREQFTGCFQVFTETGPKIVLPNKMAEEIRNHPAMNFNKAIEAEFFGRYPGFDAFKAGSHITVMVDAVRGKLTQSLNLITADLSEEAMESLDSAFGNPKVWTEIMYKPALLDVIARVSSRVFLGPELATNQEWLAVSKEYAIDCFIAARVLRQWPFFLQPIVHWFLPECRKVRDELRRARKIIAPVVEKRREMNRTAIEAGKALSKTADTIGWLDTAAKGREYDVALSQLGLSFAAVHTTSELMCGIIGDLAKNPEYFEPLREEIHRVLGAKGWTKTALYDLKLMDSVMKESQRHHPGDIAAMARYTTDKIKLSDGTVLPKNALTMVSTEKALDESIFPEPKTYRGRRFLGMRELPGQENKWQFVTTSPEHLSFGHGVHACPGRFFASNEIKVILCHMLLKYDWKLPAGGLKEDRSFGQESVADPTAVVLFKERNDPLLKQLQTEKQS